MSARKPPGFPNSMNESCPRCGAEFPPRPAVVDLGVAPSLFHRHEIPPRVQCTGCSLQFRSRAIRYFGFLDASSFRGLLVLAALLAMAAFLALVFL